jgi:hypothetical protein
MQKSRPPLGPNSISSITSSKVIKSLISAKLSAYLHHTYTSCILLRDRGWRRWYCAWVSLPFPAWHCSRWTRWRLCYFSWTRRSDYQLPEVDSLVHSLVPMLTIIYNLVSFSNCYNLAKRLRLMQRGINHFHVNMNFDVAKDLKSRDSDIKSVFSRKRCLGLSISECCFWI